MALASCFVDGAGLVCGSAANSLQGCACLPGHPGDDAQRMYVVYMLYGRDHAEFVLCTCLCCTCVQCVFGQQGGRRRRRRKGGWETGICLSHVTPVSAPASGLTIETGGRGCSNVLAWWGGWGGGSGQAV